VRKSIVGLFSLALATGLAAGPASFASAAPPVAAAPSGAPAVQGAAERVVGSDELPHPLESKRRALKQAGLTDVIEGRAKAVERGGSTVVKVGRASAAPDGSSAASGRSRVASAEGAGTGRDQYVELSREGTDQILTVLAEFGDRRHPDYPDKDVNPDVPGPVVFDGPRHNNIPEPDRSVDNSTVWQDDYSRAHYRDLYFGDGEQSVKSYYERQSSGRYSVDGRVAGWVRVPYNEARYGRSSDTKNVDPVVCPSNVCANSQALVVDAINALVARYQRQGRTPAQIKQAFARFDQQDRYDYDGDGDGDFAEADGYVDHFQVVHAGGDESDGDPQQGEDALWAHRWYVAGQDQGRTGPSFNKLGGTPVGETGLFVGDYTMQPENGGVSVFTHEYGHDLGLPDHYDTSGGGSNGVEFWNLMAQSRLNGAGEPLGTRAGDLSAWDKLQLGWLDYDTVRTGQSRTLDIGPHEYNTAKAQAILAVLPDKDVVTPYGAPASGSKQYFTGNADNLSNTLTYPVDLTGRSAAELSMKARFNIESDFDYLYVEHSTDGSTWTALDGTVDGKPFVEDGSGRPAISGASGGDEAVPVAEQPLADVQVPLTALAGKKGQLRLLYRTDGGYAGGGALLDDLRITADGTTVLLDDVEGTSTAVLDGFSVVGSSATAAYDNYYLASNRSYVSYDKYLQTGPYNFDDPARPDHVEHFSYQQGLLVSYWDTSQADNNTSVHPGEGLILPVDAHPAPILKLDGTAWRTRVQVFDAPFSRQDAASFTLHDTVTGVANRIKGQPANPLFDDTKSYWDSIIPTSSVKVPRTGTTMRVTKQNGTSMTVRVGYQAPQG